MAAMISPVSISPHRYQPADDLEIPSNGDHESSEGSDSMSSDTPPEVDKAETSGYIHPDDSMHQHWYETTTRLRCVFYVFFSLAVMVSIAMGATTEIFFSLMATPPDEGLSVGVVVAVVFVPIFLLCTAVYVDECVDVGLDAADRPCFGLWRATITTAGRAISPKIHTDHVEKLLIFLIEGIPIIFAVITISLSTSLTYWYKDLFRGYCLGGLIFALLVCGSYVLCHIFVGHNPHRDDMMACTYHNMRPLGVFKRVVKKPLDTGEERQPHWGRCVMYFFSGLVIEGIVLGIFVIFHNFHCVFIGQMIATILWAMAVRNYAPRLLGKAFWFTFVFFIILTVGLLVGTLAQTKAGPEIQEANNDRLKPLAYGPDAKEYGKTDQDFNGLPLHFELSPWAPGPGYPVCKAYWGFPGYSQVNSLGILDLAVLAFSSSMWDEAAIRRGLGNMLNGTVLEDFELLEVEDPRTVGRWIVISFPKLKLRVLSVRGTSSVQDAYADLKLYSSVAVLQFMAILTPVLSLMPVAVTRRLVKSELGNALFGNKDIWKRLEVAAAEHKKAAREKGEILILTGHSLGGALVGAVSSRVAVDGIGFSPPGLYYQVLKYHIKLKELYDSFTIIQPSNDVVPRVDRQRGMIEWIDCDENPATCHRLTHTACELWVKCGDERKRDWRSVCSEWYSRSDVNLATDVS